MKKKLQDISSTQIYYRQRKTLITILKLIETMTHMYFHSNNKRLIQNYIHAQIYKKTQQIYIQNLMVSSEKSSQHRYNKYRKIKITKK